MNGDTVLIGAPGCTTISCLQPLNTTFNAANTLSASLPGSFIPTQGTYNVYVRTAFGTLSAASPLTVTLGIISLNPSSVTQNSGAQNLVVTSSGGFQPGAVVLLNGQPLVTTFNSPTQLTAALTAANVSVAGTFFVTVQNPESLASNSLPFVVVPLGQLTSVSPNTAFAGTGPLTIQLAGSNFGASDVVRFNGTNLSTTYNSPQSLTAIIPANLLTNAGNFTVSVVNALGSVTNAVNFAVTLQITGLSPASVNAGGPAFSITATLTGGVTRASFLTYGGTQLVTTAFTSTTITATVPASLIANAGTPPVFATDGNNISNTVNHLVLGTLTLTTISPNYVDAGSAGVSITLLGVGFDRLSTATANGVSLATTFVNSTTLTALVPANTIATPGTIQIGVTDSQNRTSNQLPLAVLTPLTITSLSPASANAGAAQFILTVNGTGFDTSTVIFWNNGGTTALATTFVSSTQLTAVVPASLLANGGTATVFAIDRRERTSNAVSFSILGASNRLTITSLNPSVAQTGTVVNLIITGTGFATAGAFDPEVSNSVTVLFGSFAIGGTILSGTQIAVTIPAAANSVPGVIPVSVRLNDGRTSNSLPFNSIQNPYITNVSPSTVNVNQTGQIITVDGLLFNSGSLILVNGQPVPTTYINSTRLTAVLPAIPGGGYVSIQVSNPRGLLSNTIYIEATGSNRTQVLLTSILPSSTLQGGPAFTITGNGSGFLPGAFVTFGSTQLVTQVVGSTQVTAIVPASLIAQSGEFPVFVTNPNGTSSNAVLFVVISGRPSITSLSPPSISAGAPQFNLVVNGNGFKSGATVSFGGVSVNTTFGSANQLTAVIPATLVRNAGPVAVIVTNPDGAASDPFTFIVNPFSLTSINPSTANAGGDSFTMTLTGVGFLSGATATFNGTSLATTYVNSTTLTASVPASLIAVGGNAPVTVINPDSAVAGPLNFTIRFTITLTAISPSTASANSKSVTITATGSGFVQGATIQFNGASIPSTFGSATSVTGTIPAEALTETGSFPVTVSNPNGDTSNALTFTVTPALPLPVITSISPTTAPVGSPALTLTVNGSNFVQGSTVTFGGTNSATTFLSATQLRATVSAAQLSQAGTFTVVVTNPDGNVSNSVSFIVLTPLSITSLSPAALPAGGSSATLVIAGSGIVNGATVQVGGTTVRPDTTSPTQISLTVPASVLATAGQLNVTVTNPDGTVSNALVLTIVAFPTISINATISPAGSNQVTLTLDQPAPLDLTGTLVLTFASSSSNTPAKLHRSRPAVRRRWNVR